MWQNSRNCLAVVSVRAKLSATGLRVYWRKNVISLCFSVSDLFHNKPGHNVFKLKNTVSRIANIAVLVSIDVDGVTTETAP